MHFESNLSNTGHSTKQHGGSAFPVVWTNHCSPIILLATSRESKKKGGGGGAGGELWHISQWKGTKQMHCEMACMGCCKPLHLRIKLLCPTKSNENPKWKELNHVKVIFKCTVNTFFFRFSKEEQKLFGVSQMLPSPQSSWRGVLKCWIDSCAGRLKPVSIYVDGKLN